ncbi:MAG: TIGR00159 family protein [bacterium]|nr:TIGR00159 family protein [bacterium]
MLERLSAALHFQDLSPLALIDILLLAIVIYQLLLVIRGTRSVNILVAMAVIVIAWLITGPGVFHLNAVHSILSKFLFFLPIAVIVLFQNQIRHALANLGRNPFAALLPRRVEDGLIEEVTLAAVSLASKRLGALIVIERDMGLRTFIETGIGLDALVSYDLLMNVFTRRSPLHDGAVIVAEGRIKAASCYLPLTTQPSLSRTYGTRHRAAIGITEESDAIAVVVSEERGLVSLAEAGKITENLNAKALERALHAALTPKSEKNGKKAPAQRGAVATRPSDA